ncbi:MAG TPA: hypothetical protein VF581_00435 [Flavobacterium sp.]|jgi:hypothetical protein
MKLNENIRLFTCKLNFYPFAFSLALLFLSCSSNKKTLSGIIGREFKDSTQNRVLTLKILDFENLELTNVFNCTNLEEKYKKVIFKKKYNLKGKKILLRDSIFKLDVPFVDNSSCIFLAEKQRLTPDKRLPDGRLVRTNRDELYKMQNIDIIKIVGDYLVYIKETKKGTRGYLFK